LVHIQVLVISGAMGVGKTAVMAEASDLLTDAEIIHGAIDADALGLAHVPERPDGLELRNLKCVSTNYLAAGVERILIACAVESIDERERIRAAAGSEHLTVCRLIASPDTARRRLRARETGVFQDRYLRRARELDQILDAAALEDFRVDNDDRAITDVAREVLVRAGWLTGPVSR